MSLQDSVVRSSEMCKGVLCCLGSEEWPVPCVCSISLITVWTILRMSNCINLLQLVILKLQLLRMSQCWCSHAAEMINAVGRFCLLL